VIERPEVQEELDKTFACEHICWILQNGKFDGQYLKADPKKYGIPFNKKVVCPSVRVDFDTMLAHYCIDERPGTHGLKLWAREFFDAPNYEDELRPYLPTKDTPYSAIPDEVRWKYLAHDVVYTRKGKKVFIEKMIEEGTYDVFQKLIMPAANALMDIELDGVLLDVPKLRALKQEAEPKMEEARKVLEKEAEKIGWSPLAFVRATGSKTLPKELNPKSYPQMQWVAYDLCKMPLFDGKKSISKDAVDAYKHRHPFWKALADYKQVADLFGTYVKGMLERVDADSRIRPDFLIHGTVTGRLSCTDPNLMNIPRKSFVKDLFIAPEDSVIVSVDYKTLEVVVAAILSNDQEMLRPFREGKDFHMNTTMDVFSQELQMLRQWTETKNVQAYLDFLERPQMLEMRQPDAALKYLYTWEDKDNRSTYKLRPVEEIEFEKLEDLIVDYLRFLTKFITFGIMYGRKAKSLAEGELNCTVAEAERYIANFHRKYKDFYRWMKRMQKQAKTQGYVRNLFGRKRRWKFITSENVYEIENQAVNTPIQGTASDINLFSLIKLHNIFKQEQDPARRNKVLFPVHDSIVFEVKKCVLQETLDIIHREMTTMVFETDVPFNVDIEVGPSYGKVEEVVKDPVTGRWVPKKPDLASDFLKEVLQYK